MSDREVIRALSNAIEDIQWMSAGKDFGPDGIAYRGWIKVRKRLERYERILDAALKDGAPAMTPAERLRAHAAEARVKVKLVEDGHSVRVPDFVLAEIIRCAQVIDATADRVATLEAALLVAAEQFEFYEREHRAKARAAQDIYTHGASLIKADTNRDMAAKCRASTERNAVVEAAERIINLRAGPIHYGNLLDDAMICALAIRRRALATDPPTPEGETT